MLLGEQLILVEITEILKELCPMSDDLLHTINKTLLLLSMFCLKDVYPCQ